MGSILKRRRKDGKTVYLAQVRRTGHGTQSESFESHAEARRWMTRIEADLDTSAQQQMTKPAQPPPPVPTSNRPKRKTEATRSETPEMAPKPEPKGRPRAKDRRRVHHLIDRYMKEIVPQKASQEFPKTTLAWWKDKLGQVAIDDLTPAHIAQMKSLLMTARTKAGTKRRNSTVNRYLASISHVFSVAVKEWFWMEDNPALKVQKLREPPGRVRFLTDDERERLLEACRVDPPALFVVVVLALYTGMRYGEVTGLRWQDIDFARHRLTLQKTKNRERRGIPLIGPAMDVLVRWAAENPDVGPKQLLFPGPIEPSRPITLKRPWLNAVKRAGIENFHFHDLRHCTASYMAMSGATPQEIAEVLGHKTLQMVHRYSHLAETHVRGVLEKMASKFSMDTPAES